MGSIPLFEVIMPPREFELESMLCPIEFIIPWGLRPFCPEGGICEEEDPDVRERRTVSLTGPQIGQEGSLHFL